MSKKTIHTSGKYEKKQQNKLNRTSSYKSSQNHISERKSANDYRTDYRTSSSNRTNSRINHTPVVTSCSFSSAQVPRSSNYAVKTLREQRLTKAYNPSRQYENLQQKKNGYVNSIQNRDSVRLNNAVRTGNVARNRDEQYEKNVYRESSYRMVKANVSSINSTPKVKTNGLNMHISEPTRRFIQEQLKKSDDTGLQAISMGISGAYGLKKYYETVYKGTTLGLNVGKVMAKTGYKIATGVYHSTANTVNQFRKYGVRNTIHYQNSLKVAKVVGNKKTKKLERSIGVIKKDGRFYVKGIGATSVKMGKASLKTSVKSGSHIVKTATSQGIAIVEQGLDSTDDLGAQAISMGVKATRGIVAGTKVGAKATRFTYRGIKTGAKRGVKTAQTSAKAMKYLYKNGWKKSGQELTKATAKSVKNVIHGLANVIKNLLLGAGKGLLAGSIGFFLLAVVLIIAVPTVLFSIIFGGTGISADNTTWDVHSYVLEQTQQEIEDYADSVLTKYNELDSSGNYEIISLYNSLTGEEITVDRDTIKSSIPTAEDFTEVIEPVYYVLMVTRYEFSPTETEKKDTYDYLWNMIDNFYTQKLSVVYCTDAPEGDGSYYAANGCLRPSETHYHTSDSGRSCCSTIEVEIEGEAGTAFSCSGYQYCLGHRRIRIVMDFNGINALIAEEWGDRINELELKESLTDAEIEELKELKSNKQFCLDYVDFLSVKDENYNAEYSTTGGGSGVNTNIDISDYEITNDNSVGASIANAGLQKVGCNYAWGGLTWCYDVEKAGQVGVDCSGFTYLIFKEHGINIPRTSSAQGQGGVEIASLADAQAGDLIFYGRSGVSGIGHVGIYLGDGRIVHASNPAPYPQGGVKISNATYKTILAIRRYW